MTTECGLNWIRIFSIYVIGWEIISFESCTKFWQIFVTSLFCVSFEYWWKKWWKSKNWLNCFYFRFFQYIIDYHGKIHASMSSSSFRKNLYTRQFLFFFVKNLQNYEKSFFFIKKSNFSLLPVLKALCQVFFLFMSLIRTCTYVLVLRK